MIYIGRCYDYWFQLRTEYKGLIIGVHNMAKNPLKKIKIDYRWKIDIATNIKHHLQWRII